MKARPLTLIWKPVIEEEAYHDPPTTNWHLAWLSTPSVPPLHTPALPAQPNQAAACEL